MFLKIRLFCMANVTAIPPFPAHLFMKISLSFVGFKISPRFVLISTDSTILENALQECTNLSRDTRKLSLQSSRKPG